MKILFISDNFLPEVNAPATRTHQHCREWVKQGAEVTVITCVPNFPRGKVYEGYKNKLYQVEEVDGIRVIRVWSYIAANKGFLKRVLDFVSFAFMAFWVGLFRRTDVIIATSPQFFAAVGGWFLSFCKRKPWIMEVRDLWPESIKAVGAMQDGRTYRMLERLELFLYRQASKVVVVTDKFKENLTERGIAADKIHVVKNGVVLDEYTPQPSNTALRHELGIDDKFVFTYLGTHGMAHGLNFIVASASKIKDEQDVHFLFIGDGAEKNTLIEMQEKLALDNITLHPPVPKKDVHKYISASDVALVCLKKSDTFKSVIPSKIFENAAMQCPILLGVEGESKDIIESYGAGLCYEPENEREFIDKVKEMKNSNGKYKIYQQGCERLAKDFSRKKLADKMFNVIKNVVTK